MKRVIIVSAKKGGSGKSTTAKALIDLTRAAGRTVSAWDLDGQTGSLAFVYPPGDSIAGVGTEDIRDPSSKAAWLDAFHCDANDVLLDVPGGALDDLLRTFTGGAKSLVAAVKESGRELVIVSVLGLKKDSTATAQEAVEIFGTAAHHVIVLNGFFGDRRDFIVYDGFSHPTTGEAMFGRTSRQVSEVGGETMFVPRMEAQSDIMLDLEGMSMARGAGAISEIGRKHSGNVRYWLAEVKQSFAGTWLDVDGNTPSEPSKSRKSSLASVSA